MARKMPKTKVGRAITPQIADEPAVEAERGYDLAGASRRRLRGDAPSARRDHQVVAILDSAPWDDEELTADELRAVEAAGHEAGIPWSDTPSGTE
jgi:hypothetical protein